MGGGAGGGFGNTSGRKTDIRNKISSLPKNPNDLLKQGWKETTNRDMAKKHHHEHLEIRLQD